MGEYLNATFKARGTIWRDSTRIIVPKGPPLAT